MIWDVIGSEATVIDPSGRQIWRCWRPCWMKRVPQVTKDPERKPRVLPITPYRSAALAAAIQVKLGGPPPGSVSSG